MYKDKAILNAIKEMPKGRRSCCSIATAAGSLALFATPPIREIILSPPSPSISFRQSGRRFTVYFSLSHFQLA